jgi:16S rRNA U516 pseudouridylate synthase RsuA-like enzyme
MADAGVAARRICEQMIESGKVSVNGEVTRKLPVFVDPENDTIIVEGRPLQRPERKLYLMVFKPERMLVTNADEPEFDRATIADFAADLVAGLAQRLLAGGAPGLHFYTLNLAKPTLAVLDRMA